MTAPPQMTKSSFSQLACVSAQTDLRIERDEKISKSVSVKSVLGIFPSCHQRASRIDGSNQTR